MAVRRVSRERLVEARVERLVAAVDDAHGVQPSRSSSSGSVVVVSATCVLRGHAAEVHEAAEVARDELAGARLVHGVDLVAAHRGRDAGELDRERAAEAAAGVGVGLLDELDVRQRRDQRRARGRVAQPAALVAGAVERDRPARADGRRGAGERREERAELDARARARRRARGSPANSSGQACSIVAAHEPESTTIGPSLAASAASVVAATRRASSGKPEFQAGWPQHVWPSGSVTR